MMGVELSVLMKGEEGTGLFTRISPGMDFRSRLRSRLKRPKLLDPTLMTTMIGYEDRQVNMLALTQR